MKVEEKIKNLREDLKKETKIKAVFSIIATPKGKEVKNER